MNRSPITYGMLKKALLKLGFAETVTETHLLYENTDSGAVVLLPHVEDNQPAQPVHLQTVRWTAVEMGLADADSFDRILSGNGVRSKARLQAAAHSARPRRPKSDSQTVSATSAPAEAA